MLSDANTRNLTESSEHGAAPRTNRGDVSLYPNMGLKAFFVLVFSSAFGVGLGLVASPLIGGGSNASPSGQPTPSSGQQTSSATGERTWFGFLKEPGDGK